MFASLTDQCGNSVSLKKLPQRIISLVPSQTELLYDLGLETSIVGITRFCVHPAEALENKKVVGGTKKIVEKRIKELQPDLIICNKEENTKEIADFCQSIAPTYISDISTLDEALEMIQQVGMLTGTSKSAQQLTTQINTKFKELPEFKTKKRALYLIWKDPYMSIGSDTFIHDMMEKVGFRNVLTNERRYPQLTIDQIVDFAPDIILFSSEPYNFKEDDKIELINAFKARSDEEDYIRQSQSANEQKNLPQCITVDGEFFSWYGSRLSHAPTYFSELQKVMTTAQTR